MILGVRFILLLLVGILALESLICLFWYDCPGPRDGQYINALAIDSVDGDGILLFYVSMLCIEGGFG